MNNYSSGKMIYDIPTVDINFRKWSGVPLINSFGRKPLLDYQGTPMFAELAIQKLASSNGWSSRWVSTYAAVKENPRFLDKWLDKPIQEQKNNPIGDSQTRRFLEKIASRKNNSFSGCWDIFAWKNSRYMFLESKRTKKDKIRKTQLSWLEYGLLEVSTLDNFLVVQWDYINYDYKNFYLRSK